MDLHPPPLWIPPKPAIIRAHQVPRTPAEARGIQHRSEDALAVVGRPLGGKVTRFRFVTSAQGSAEVVVPTVARKDDVAVLWQFGRTIGTSTAPALVTPSGFTATNTASTVYSLSSFNIGFRVAVSYKKLLATDPGTVLTGINAGTNSKVLQLFRPNGRLTSVVARSPSGVATTTAPGTQSIGASAYVAPAIVLAGIVADSSSFTPTGTLLTSASILTVSVWWLAYEFVSGTSVARTIGVNDTGDVTSLQSFVLEAA